MVRVWSQTPWPAVRKAPRGRGNHGYGAPRSHRPGSPPGRRQPGACSCPALTEAAPTPAWRSRPVWAVLPTADKCIDPGVHRFSYQRMGATVTEIEGASHVAMISHPKEVAQVVMTAVRTCAARST